MPNSAEVRLLEAILDAAPDGLFAVRLDHGQPALPLVFWNTRMAALTGYTTDEIAAVDWLSTLWPDPNARAVVEARLHDAMHPLRDEPWTIVTRDGTERRLSVSTSAITGAGEPGIVVALARPSPHTDGTGVGPIASGVFHELHDLVAAVQGYTGLALEALPASNGPRRMLLAIADAAGGALELTRRLLATAGRSRRESEPILLDDIVREAAGLVEADPNTHTALSLALGQAPVRGDLTALRQIVVDSVTSAIEATGDGGEIVLSTGVRYASADALHSSFVRTDLPPGTYAWLEVRDAGRDTAGGSVSRIFDPLFSTRRDGRGMGLAAVLGIVRDHGGTVRLASEVGAGSTFEILLPLDTTAAPSRPVPVVEPRLPPVGGTVLVVDDNPTVREFAKQAIEEAGYDVIAAADGYQGVNLFRTHAPVIVAAVVDFAMPRLSGVVIARLRQLSPGLPILLMSGYSEEEMRRTTTAAATAFIAKPFLAADLVRRLSAMLGRSGGSVSTGSGHS